MYRGEEVPGFPCHPHRGYETITVSQKGFVDHVDTQGTAGRYGNGDVHWLTAGKGTMHSEMFPLVNEKKKNPLDLFQIWLNSPRSKKNVDPQSKMYWSEKIPVVKDKDEHGRKTNIKVIMGNLGKTKSPKAPKSDTPKASTKLKEGIPHYTADGELYEGPTHKDAEGRLMTGEVHNEDSEYLYHKEELEAQPSVTSTYPGQAASGSIAPALLK